MASSLWLVAVAALAVLASADPFMGKRTLTVIGDSTIRQSHSALFAGLESNGHVLDFKLATEKFSIIDFGVYLYDNILLFTPASEDIPSLSTETLLAFVEAGGNVVVAASEESTKGSWALGDFLEESGVQLSQDGRVVIDHVNAANPSGDHTTVLASGYTDSKYVVGQSAAKGSVVFKGIAQSFSADNYLALPVLKAGETAYVANPNKPVPTTVTTGTDIVLVTAVQARNNARLLFLGSLWMLSNEAFAFSTAAGPAANQYFATAAFKWVLQESGVLRASNVRHYREDGSEAGRMLSSKQRPNLPVSIYPEPEVAPQALVYRINDDIQYLVDIQIYNGEAWVPYSADDVQLEFVMLNPYVRTFLKPDDKGTFSAHFKIPDVYGIYKFRVQYRRPGLSVLSLSDQVSIRPFRHNEYERFINAANPYYVSALSVMSGFFVFSLFFLFTKAK